MDSQELICRQPVIVNGEVERKFCGKPVTRRLHFSHGEMAHHEAARPLTIYIHTCEEHAVEIFNTWHAFIGPIDEIGLE